MAGAIGDGMGALLAAPTDSELRGGDFIVQVRSFPAMPLQRDATGRNRAPKTIGPKLCRWMAS